MRTDLADVERLKKGAADRALELVRPGMLVGLGSGTTAAYFIEGLGHRVRDGLAVTGVATSANSQRLAVAGGIPLVEAIDRPLDLAVDGADEIDPDLNLVKGRGGALLREKIVARASRAFIVIADGSKAVQRLGRGPVPVEVVPFLWEVTKRHIEQLDGRAVLRSGSAGPFQTDSGNLILDVQFAGTVEPSEVDRSLHAIPGVVEHGLFIAMARAVILSEPGGIRVLGQLP